MGASGMTSQTDIQKWQMWGMTAAYRRSDPASRRPPRPCSLARHAWLGTCLTCLFASTCLRAS